MFRLLSHIINTNIETNHRFIDVAGSGERPMLSADPVEKSVVNGLLIVKVHPDVDGRRVRYNSDTRGVIHLVGPLDGDGDLSRHVARPTSGVRTSN